MFPRVLLVVAMGVLLPALAAPAGDVEDAADRVAAAHRVGDAEALAKEASAEGADPWMVADELAGRGEAAAAKAFAAACAGKDTEGLAAYLEAWRPPEGDGAHREAMAEARRLLSERKAAEALEVLGKAERAGADVLAARLAYARGVALRNSGDPAGAAEAFLHSMKIAEEAGWLRMASTAAVQAGEVALAGGDAGTAYSASEDLLRIEGRRGRKAGEADATRRTGVLHLMTGNVQAGKETLEKAVALAGEGGDPGVLGRCLANFGAACLMTGEVVHAEEALSRAVGPLEEARDRAFLNDVLGNLGNARIQLARFESALETLARATEVARSLGDEARVAGYWLQEAQALTGLSRYDDALSRVAKAKEAARKLGNGLLEGHALMAEGNAHFEKGDFAQALRCQDRALEFLEEAGDRRNYAITVGLIGNLHINTGDYRRAVDWLKRCIALQKEVGDALAAAIALGNLGTAHIGLKEWDEAVACLEEAIRIEEGLGAPEGVATFRMNLASIYRELGRLDDAEAAVKEAMAFFERSGDRAAVAKGFGMLGEVYLDRGDLEEALDCVDRALAVTEEVGAREASYFQRVTRGKILLARGDPSGAVDACLAALEDLAVTVRGLGSVKGTSAREQYQGAYDTGITASVAAGDAASLWTFLESERAGALLESLRSQVALEEAAIPPALREAEAAARRGVEGARTALEEAIAGKGLAAIAAARKGLEEARKKEREVLERIQREAGALGDVLYPRPVPLEEGVRLFAGGEEALVLFGGTSTESVALVVAGEEARIVPLGSRGDLDAACERFRPQEMAVNATEAAANLRGLLIDRLALPEGVRRVHVSPWGAVSFVALSALNPDWEWVYLPSATTLSALRGADGRGTGVLALGDPDYGVGSGEGGTRSGASFTALPATRAEAEAIGTALLLGREATETGLRDALARKERWKAIHLACHGILDPKDSTRSALALAQDGAHDGMLSVLEVFGLRVQANLVVLSACETARGEVFQAEGVMGFPRAFLLAGAPRVIVSLWKVDDEATAALMGKFYEHWSPRDGGPGVPAATALRRAREWVRSQEKWSHPAYWAAWQLWGRGD